MKKITSPTVKALRERAFLHGSSPEELADDYGLALEVVVGILEGTTHRHVGGPTHKLEGTDLAPWAPKTTTGSNLQKKLRRFKGLKWDPKAFSPPRRVVAATPVPTFSE